VPWATLANYENGPEVKFARARVGSLEAMKRNKCLAVLALKRFSTIAFHLAALKRKWQP
jgi:hypothetical protein